MTPRVVVLAGGNDVAREVAGAVQSELAAAGVPVTLVRARADADVAGGAFGARGTPRRPGRDACALVRDAVRALQIYAEGQVDVVLCCPPRVGLACVKRLRELDPRIVLATPSCTSPDAHEEDVATHDPAAEGDVDAEPASEDEIEDELADLVDVDVVRYDRVASSAVAVAVRGSLGIPVVPDHPGWLTGDAGA